MRIRLLLSGLLLTVSVPMLTALLSPGRAADGGIPVLDPDLPYQARRGNAVSYDVDYSVVVTAPYHTKRLRVWLPLPQTDAGQAVEEKDLSSFPTKVEPKMAKEPAFGNKFAYFEFVQPEGAQVIRHRFKIMVWELHWDLEPGRVSKVERWPAGFDRYLRTEQALVVDERFRKLAADIVPERKGEARDLAAVMRWVNEHMKYDHSVASLQASSEQLLNKGMGHCSDYHGFCAAVGRALGYPTRVTYGINPFPKNSPSHCKLEAYLPPYGWVSFDVSETQKLVGDINKDPKLGAKQQAELARAANDRLLHGFRDNTWYVQTKGTDFDLAPPAGKRVAVVRTIYAEADGIALPEPDPANPHKREFSWMTIHQYTPDRLVEYPFKGTTSLLHRGN